MAPRQTYGNKGTPNDTDLQSRLERLDAQMVMLQTKVIEQEAVAEELQASIQKELGVKHGGVTLPWHPFFAQVITGGTQLEIKRGVVFAGALASYNWPNTGDTTTVNASSLAAGVHVIYMDITVNPSYGFFTANYKPVLLWDEVADILKVQKGALSSADIQTTRVNILRGGIIICDVTVTEISGTKYFTNLHQRWFCDMYIPVYRCLYGFTYFGHGVGTAMPTAEEQQLATPETRYDYDNAAFTFVQGTTANQNRIHAFATFFEQYEAYVAGWYIDIFWETTTASGATTELTGAATI